MRGVDRERLRRGGGSGFGEALAHRRARAGARPAIIDLRTERAERCGAVEATRERNEATYGFSGATAASWKSTVAPGRFGPTRR